MKKRAYEVYDDINKILLDLEDYEIFKKKMEEEEPPEFTRFKVLKKEHIHKGKKLPYLYDIYLIPAFGICFEKTESGNFKLGDGYPVVTLEEYIQDKDRDYYCIKPNNRTSRSFRYSIDQVRPGYGNKYNSKERFIETPHLTTGDTVLELYQFIVYLNEYYKENLEAANREINIWDSLPKEYLIKTAAELGYTLYYDSHNFVHLKGYDSNDIENVELCKEMDSIYRKIYNKAAKEQRELNKKIEFKHR